jgi:zinc protease
MRRSFPFLVLAAFFIVSLRGAIPFPQAGSDLKPDPAAKFGVLPNGLRYVIRPNKEPRERASLRLLVEAGALQETEQQRGLAHFLEHMAFNGSEHYAADSLIKFFQRMGMNFGGDTNANTGFERTVYLLELPDTKPTTLTEGLRVFSDYAGALLLDPKEIDKERGIILSEKRTGDSVEFRTALAQYGFMFSGTLLPKRFPIGEAEVIKTAQRDQFLDFYNTWYRPEIMSVVVVGDIDPIAVEKQLVDTFTPLKPRAPARPAPDLGRISTAEGTRAFYHFESEAPNTTVTIGTVTPYTREPDTAAVRLKYLPRSLAHAMINRRLSILAKKENAPFFRGGAGAGESLNFYRETSISLDCREDQWAAALGVADQELRRALEHGFQPPELKEVVANYRNGLEQAVKTASTRRSDGLAEEITDGLLEREVFTTPEDDLALIGPALDRITVDDCLASLRTTWSPKHRLVMVTGNAKIQASVATPEQAIASTYEKSRATPVAPPETIADQAWAYTQFGAAGKIAQRQRVEDLDITLITFANGVRLNLKKTDFEANSIHINVRLGTGQLTEPRERPGLAAYTSLTYNAGGLGKHSSDDLRRILAGKTVGASFGTGDDAFVIGGGTNREDLLLEMQLIAARITDPGFRPEAARQGRKAIDEAYLSFEHTAGGPFTLEVARLLAGGDHRFGLPPKTEILKRNLDEVKAWVTPQLQHGAIEIAIVGDIDVDATIAAVAQTLGALPPREPRPALAELRQVKFPSQPFTKEYTIASEIPKGTVVVYWPTTDANDISRDRRLGVLGDVLTDRMRVKVREELGDAYGYSAGNNSSEVYPGYGYFSANVVVDPPKAKPMTDILVNLFDDVARNGVTEEELDRAKKPMLTAIRESIRTNGYWLGRVLSRAQEKPEVLDWCRSREKDITAVSKADLDALAKMYLTAARACRVTVVPQPTAAVAPIKSTMPPGKS